MGSLRIIWDVLFRGDKVNEKGVDRAVATAMDEHTSSQKIESVLRWNTVLSGQKTSRAGFTSGLRYIIPVDYLSSDEIKALTDTLITFKNDKCESSNCMLSESLEFPLGRQAKAKFPILGKIALTCNFTHGMGYTELKQIQNAKTTQTKDTKNGLDPTRMGSGSSGGLFSEEYRQIMSNPLWFLMLTTSTEEGYKPPVDVLSGGSDGGMYQLSFDLRDAISELVSVSKGVWWDPLNEDDLNLNPQLILDPTTIIDNPLDPNNYYHHDDKNQNLIDNVLKIEMEQTGDEDIVGDLSYVLKRIIKNKRISRQLTGETHGLVSGLEEALIGEHIIKPWISEEFFNCLAFFLMTRKPKYWRNGKSEIQLLHSLDGLNIELLKD
jgi:hypothetical protein